MTTYLPSWRGRLALLLAIVGGVILPGLLPARSGHTGRLSGSVAIEVCIIAAIIVFACIAASILAWFQAQRSDRIASVISLALTVWLFVMFIYAAK
jgi:hypothetical protein